MHDGTILIGGAACLLVLLLGCGTTGPGRGPLPGDLDSEARAFAEAYTARVRPLEKEVALANWEAYTTGTDAAFERSRKAQNALDAVLSDKETFARLRRLRGRGRPANPLLARQLDVIYFTCLEKQLDEKLLARMVELGKSIEKVFNNYRGRIDGKEVTENDIRKILKDSGDSVERRKAWEASKGVGPEVMKAGLPELVRIRNQAARRLGFENFYILSLATNEQDEEALLRLFKELDELTEGPFRALKAEIDEKLAKRYGIAPDALETWHYHDPFFQEPPKVFEADLDAVYQARDILQICRDFYAGIGLPIDRILERSDLHEKPGKSSHAFCFDIDREGDIRVLANIKDDEYWMGTMLHELGHAVYDDAMDRSLPWLLRTASHTLTTEGIAMLFERFSKNPDWMRRVAGVPAGQAEAVGPGAARMLRAHGLIFSRWCQVMLHFERGMYRNPDQDLNRLWWDLVERYQGIRRPLERNQPDFASKIHVVSAPVYYHNYMMGELFASQVHHALVKALHGDKDPRSVSYAGDPRTGKFLRDRVLALGTRRSWNDLTEFATGAPLNARAFAADFVR